jgi:uncharacterized delta-60 repeat protein
MKKIILTILLACTVTAFSQEPALDPNFNVGSGADSWISNTKQLEDGKILIAGDFLNYDGNIANRIARLNADGSFDPTFVLNLFSSVEAMLVEEDGKIVVTQLFGGIYRYNADGTEDTSFSRTVFRGEGFYRLLKQGGKYIVAGNFSVYDPIGNTGYNNLARLNYDGTLDTTFTPTAFGETNFLSLFVQPDGKIVMTGAFDYYNGNTVPNVIRLDENGSLDTTFNAGTGAAGTVRTVAMQPDGKYIISGTFESFNGVAKHLNARLNSDGSLDNTFNYTTTVGLPEDGVVGYKIFVQPNGKILIGGAFKDAMYDIEGTPDGSVPVYLTLLNTDGSTDDSFTVPFDDSVFSFDVQDDGKLLVGGWFRNYNGQPQKSLARLNYNALFTHAFDKPTVTVYPNPVSGQLSIDLNDASSVNAIVTITDVLGKQVYNTIHNDINMTVDMSAYNTGIYFLKLQSSGKVYTQKIIKN